MAYESVKNQIDAYIKANGVNLITGPVLNAVLTTMLDELGEGYAFQGVLNTTDTPSPAADIPQAWLASAGTYLGGSITVDEGELALIYHTADGWSKETVYRGVQLSFDAIVSALGYTPADEADLAEKQDTISDLPDIRSGAALGSTSVQPVDIEDMVEAEPIGSIVPPVNPSKFATTEEVSQLGQKVTELSAEEALDLDEEIKVTTEDGQTTLIDITQNGVDAHNLKRNGQDVLTQHQDISNLATKTELSEGLAEKQDVIEEISIDDTQDDGTSEHIWASDDGAEEYAKVNSYGFFAKNFPLYGKKWAVLGDSFTAGDGVGTFPDGKYAGKPKTYPYLISLRTGIELYNFFGGGRTLAFPAVPGDFVNSVTNPTRDFYYQNIPADTDIITIYLGINDSHHRPGSGGGDGEDNTGIIPLGTISDNTTATFYGAWNVVLSWLIENRPFAHIGIIVSNGCETIDYRTATLEIAQKYGVPYIDLNGDERTPFMLRAKNTNIPGAIQTIRIQKQAVDYDGTITGAQNWHPNEDAHLFESTFIENFLRTI